MNSKVHMYVSGRELARRGPLTQDHLAAGITLADLKALGIDLMAMDTALIGPAASGGHIRGQFLETVLPGIVSIGTQVLRADELMGVMNVGNWYDHSIRQDLDSAVGKAEIYGDTTNIPLASYAQTSEERNIIIFEQGFLVGKLEEARQSAGGYDAMNKKRRASQTSLNVSRNRAAFVGFGAPDSKVYGLLNDPSLRAYLTATSSWVGATFAVLTADFQRMYDDLENRSGGNISEGDQFTFVIPTGYGSVLSTSNPVAQGETFREWITKNFPRVRIVAVPEFKLANGGANVAYLYADSVGGDEGEGGAVLAQIVPSRYQVIGSENRVKGYIEDALAATAGVMVFRPWAVTRMSGI